LHVSCDEPEASPASKGLASPRERWRSRRLRLSVATSLGSKIMATALQLVAVPLAVRALGPKMFGLYIMLTSSLSWIMFANVGIGPSLTIGIAESAAQGNRRAESRYFSSAVFLVSGVGLALVAALCLGMVFIYRYNPKNVMDDANFPQMAAGSLILASVFLAQLVLGVAEAAQAGYQEQYVINLYMMFSNISSFISLVIVVWLRPSMLGVILSLYVVPLVFRSANAVRLVGASRPHLLPLRCHVDADFVRSLFVTGAGFTLGQVGAFMLQQLGVILIGWMLDVYAVATYAVMMHLFLLAMSVVTMQAQPLWPALADAIERGELAWVSVTCRRTLRLSIAYAAAIALVVSTCGRGLVRAWYGPAVAPDLALQVSFGVYFVLNVWEYLHYTILLGFREVWVPSCALFAQGVLMILLALALIPRLGPAGASVSLCVATALVDAWLFPLLVRRAMARALPSVGA
jgi:O-antigen/teichoic acid export membrane protein